MSLLDRLAAIQKNVLEAKSEEERLSTSAKKSENDSSDKNHEWVNRPPVSQSPSKRNESFVCYKNSQRVTPLSQLVWAPHSAFRGGKFGAYFPARIALSSEYATAPSIAQPIGQDNIVVEYFGMPKSSDWYTRFLKIPRTEIRKYCLPPKSSQSQGTLNFEKKDTGADITRRWDIVHCTRMQKSLSDKKGKVEGGRIAREIMRIAKEFLIRALDKEEATAAAEAGASTDSSTGIPEGSSRGDKMADLCGLKDSNAAAISEYFDKSHKSREKFSHELRAGDYISYTHKVLRNRVWARVVAIRPEDTEMPLTLDTGDVLLSMDVITCHPGKPDDNGNFDENKSISWPIEDIKLMAGNIKVKNDFAHVTKRAAQDGNEALLRETGYQMNEGSAAKQKRRKHSNTESDQ